MCMFSATRIKSCILYSMSLLKIARIYGNHDCIFEIVSLKLHVEIERVSS